MGEVVPPNGFVPRDPRPAAGLLLACLALLVVATWYAASVLRLPGAYRETVCTVLATEAAIGYYSYHPRFTLSYGVAGTEHRYEGRAGYPPGSETFARAVVARYEIGESYPAWYDPAKPAEVALTRSRPLAPRFVALFSVLVALVWTAQAAALFLDALRERRYRAREAAAGRPVPPDAPPTLPGERLPIRLRSPDAELGGAWAIGWLGHLGGGFLTLTLAAPVARELPVGEWSDVVLSGLFFAGALAVTLLHAWVQVERVRAARLARRIVVEIDRLSLPRGRRAAVRVVVRGPLRCARVTASLLHTCEERGYHGDTYPVLLHQEEFLSAGPVAVSHGERWEGFATLEIPAELPREAPVDAEDLAWAVRVTCHSVKRRRGTEEEVPVLKADFPLFITPA